MISRSAAMRQLLGEIRVICARRLTAFHPRPISGVMPTGKQRVHPFKRHLGTFR
jgi:hypothetical protein